MKSRFHPILVALLAVLTAACSQDIISPEEQDPAGADGTNIVTYIQATEESAASKASIDGASGAFSWNTGDRIAVYANGYKISDGLPDTYDGGNAATFGFSGSNAVTEAKRSDFAVFPASLVWDGTGIRSNSQNNHTATSLTLTLPDSYTLAEVQDNVSPGPMIAANAENGKLSFKHLCALLRFTVHNIPASTSWLAFDFNGKKVQGAFTLNEVIPGTSCIETCPASGTDDIIKITGLSFNTWKDTLVVNLPVPTGTYGNVTVTAYNSSNEPVLTMTRPIKVGADWTPTRLSARKVIASLPAFLIHSSLSNGVRTNQHAVIAPSNLTYTPNTQKWAFHEHPYDICESYPDADGTVSTRYTSEGNLPIDLFGWGTSGHQFESGYGSAYQPYSTSTYNDDYGPSGNNESLSGSYANGDWGVEAGSLSGYANWRTPSMLEWQFLANSSYSRLRHTDCLWARAILSHVLSPKPGSTSHIYGVFLFPDYWDASLNGAQIVPNGGYFVEEQESAVWVTEGEYNRMIAAGAVFLPYVGSRMGTTISEGVGKRSHYWSSTRESGASNPNAYALSFSNTRFKCNNGSDRSKGGAVRLIREIQ